MDDLDRAWNDMAAATSAAVEDFAAVDEHGEVVPGPAADGS